MFIFIGFGRLKSPSLDIMPSILKGNSLAPGNLDKPHIEYKTEI